MQTFGEWIEERMIERRLTGTECAKRIGITPQAWSEWVKDRSRRKNGEPRRPRIETVEKVAIALEVSVSEVMIAARYGVPSSKQETRERYTEDQTESRSYDSRIGSLPLPDREVVDAVLARLERNSGK